MRALRSAASVIASLALLVGVPWLLATTIGNPLDRLPDLLAGDVNDHVVLAALATALYLAWAQFAVAFAVELVSAVRRTPMPKRIPGVFAGQQGLARALVSGALLLLPVTASTVVPAAHAVAMSTTDQPVRVVTHLVPSPLAVADLTSTPATALPVAPTRDVVLTESGARTWWDLAATHLGDGTAWRDLWDLNQGRVQADGTVLTTERVVLQPGWTVLVPATTNDTDGPAMAAAADDNGGVDVTVEAGDTLSEIAADHGINDWTRVWPANAGRAEPDGARFLNPDYIEPGWTITIPSPTNMGDNPGAHSGVGDNASVVAAGDTLSQIAADHGVPLDAVVAANIGRVQADGSQLTDPDDIRPGWRLVTPTDVTPTDVTPISVIPADVTPAVVTPADPDTTAPPVAPGSGTQPVPGPAVTPAPAPGTPLSPGIPLELSGADVPSGMAAGTTPLETVPSTGRDTSASDSSASTDGSSQRTVVPWIAGAGLLAGGTLLALIRHRRRQFRYRSPGRSITQTPPELRDAERDLLTAGGSGMGDVAFLDRALRGLTHSASEGLARLPDVVAARLTTDSLELILAGPDDRPPAPWIAAPSGMAWTLNRNDGDLQDDEDHRDYYAPYPTLVSIGYTPTGEQWLLDLEHVGYLSLTGDTERCMDLARFIAAELAHNTWSDTVDVTLVGFGAEMTTLNPERLTHTEHLDTTTAAASRVLVDDTAERDNTGRTVLDTRSAPGTGDVPTPHVTLVSPTAAHDVQADGSLSKLLEDLRCHPGRAAVAMVFAAGDNPGNDASTTPEARAAGPWSLRIDPNGTLTIPALGEELIAQQLPEREAADLAALLALAAVTQDHPMPPARGDQPWDEFADAAGSPLPELTTPTTGTTADHLEPGGSESTLSALPLPPRAYLERTTADEADLDALAPRVPDDVRARIETSDTDLDVDLADWYDDTTTRPRISVLGPIRVRAQGELPAGRPRLAWHTEVVTYLATRPRGATVEEFGTALWPDEPDVANKPKLRNSIYVARKWLGADPNTGQDHLPANTRTGGGAYRIIGGLLDAELFRRLRLRGVTRGEHGIPDLHAALNLVTGAPFTRRRAGGYGWLIDPALDHEYTAAIIDVAHLLATHHLAAGEPALAAAAAEVALLAGSSADTPLLDLIAASEALGNTAEADAYVKRIMANHDADVEEDLPPRTAAILHRRQWLPPAA